MRTLRFGMGAALLAALLCLAGCGEKPAAPPAQSVPAAQSAAPAASAQPPEPVYTLDRSNIPAEADTAVRKQGEEAPVPYSAVLDEAERQAREDPERIDLRAYRLTPAQAADLTARCAGREVAWELEVDGVAVPWDARELDFSGHDLAALGTDLSQIFPLLPDLERVDLCGCGFSNDEAAALQDAFPELKLVWEIVLSHWTIRTDAVAFSTMKTCADSFFLYDDEAKYLKYCTDLVALDLGHNHVSDLSFLQYMPNLKILILVDNGLSWEKGNIQRLNDLSMLQYLPKLEYLEFFVGHVKDLSFLQYTPNIVDLNISYNPVRDASYLYNLPKLERLWMEHTKIPYSEFQKLRKTYPDAKLVYYGEGSIDQGWRKHERYYAMRDMFENNYVHPLFQD